MKNFTTILFSLLIFLPIASQSQTTVFFENFDSVSLKMTLNTSDVNSTANSAGENQWIINNNYTGGSGTFTCLSFPFSWSIANTPSQPAGITNNPSSKYLHTISDVATSAGVLSSSFAAADGFCFFNDNVFSRTIDVNTTAFSIVSLKFWWVCGGGQNIHGEVYYSTNSGVSWVQCTSPLTQYKNQTTWTQATITDPIFAGKSTLRFGFRFVNQVSNTATDPGFSIDDIQVIGTTSATIATGTAPSSICPGDSMWIPFTITGSFVAGNVFTCQLSDATGSFTSPTAIGTLNGTTAGTVHCKVPNGTPSGSAYRVRIVGSNPATTGTDNGSNILINPPSLGGTAIPTPGVVCGGGSTMVALSFQVGTIITWLISTDSINWITYSPPGTNTAFNYTPVDPFTWFKAVVLKNPCEPDTSDPATIELLPAAAGGTISGQDTICISAGTTLTTTGSTGSLQWQNSIDGINFFNIPGATGGILTTGNLIQNTWYRVIAISAGCSDDTTAGFAVSVQAAPVAAFTSSGNGTTVTFTDQSTGAVSWSWLFGDGNSSANQNPVHLYSSLGTYLVTLVVSNGGCNDTISDSVAVIAAGLENEADAGVFSIAPNPGNGDFMIHFRNIQQEDIEISVIDILGNKIHEMTIIPGNRFSYRLLLGEIASGTYFLRAKTGDGIGVRKFVILD